MTTFIIEAIPNKVIKHKALIYRADTYPKKVYPISSYGRLKFYQSRSRA